MIPVKDYRRFVLTVWLHFHRGCRQKSYIYLEWKLFLPALSLELKNLAELVAEGSNGHPIRQYNNGGSPKLIIFDLYEGLIFR